MIWYAKALASSSRAEMVECSLVCRWFDVSKQVVGSVLVHIANIVLSMLSSGTFGTEPIPVKLDAIVPPIRQILRRQVQGDGPDPYHPNPCSFYLLNLAIDV